MRCHAALVCLLSFGSVLDASGQGDGAPRESSAASDWTERLLY
ncbi:hypothetical protein Mal64_32380 [Pseudobythopirellula maris]|uniref:Uncharacterized protein n=1 Tax=Pseudobythopirellula maris TaxID=2527991 RepID=A0A5C5ZKM0_9BACT|nr:hypothetical protein Mal64_32380 [Pseudobythopirellula maris]